MRRMVAGTMPAFIYLKQRRLDMGLFSFIKDAGEKLFGSKEVEKAKAANNTATDRKSTL